MKFRGFSWSPRSRSYDGVQSHQDLQLHVNTILLLQTFADSVTVSHFFHAMQHRVNATVNVKVSYSFQTLPVSCERGNVIAIYTRQSSTTTRDAIMIRRKLHTQNKNDFRTSQLSQIQQYFRKEHYRLQFPRYFSRLGILSAVCCTRISYKGFSNSNVWI